MWQEIELTKQPISAVRQCRVLDGSIYRWQTMSKYSVNANDIYVKQSSCFVSFRQKIFEDIQRFINTKDIINKVVFDLEDDRYASIKIFCC